jgi:ADP-heptose:LPS heptosyltransferase
LKKILVIQTAFIGDVILATAVPEHLHKHFPDAQIDMLVRTGNESLFKDHPFINKVYDWNKKSSKYRNLFRIIQLIREEGYDGVINLQRHTASALVTILSGAKKTSGFASSMLSVFFNHRYKHELGKRNEPGFMHEVDRCLQLTAPWTLVEKSRPVLYPSALDFSAIESYIRTPFITISPSSVWFTKQTPPDVWKKLIGACAHVQVYLLGGPGDVVLCQSLASGFSNVQVLAGKLTLLQSAALMKHAVMNYTNDSAPLHLCSAMNAPATAVFCSTIPEFGFGPLSDSSRVVQTRMELPCKPCGNHGKTECPKGHFDCGNIDLNDLLPKSV